MENGRKWRALWIWAQGNGEDIEVVRFRRAFEAPEGGRLLVRVTADSRYRLYLNGELLAFGPAKGDQFTHYYDVVETPALRPGRNVIAAEVVHYGTDRGPKSVWRSPKGAFLFEGDVLDGAGGLYGTVDSDASWSARREPGGAFALQKETFTLLIGGGESVDGRLLVHGWQFPDYDDASWTEAVVVAKTHDSRWGVLPHWLLAERTIPLMRVETPPIRHVVRGRHEGKAVARAAWNGPFGPVVVAAGETSVFELDAGELMSGHVRLEFAGGRGTKVAVLYSECYEEPPGPDGRCGGAE